jgi:hypothetical protein
VNAVPVKETAEGYAEGQRGSMKNRPTCAIRKMICAIMAGGLVLLLNRCCLVSAAGCRVSLCRLTISSNARSNNLSALDQFAPSYQRALVVQAAIYGNQSTDWATLA